MLLLLVAVAVASTPAVSELEAAIAVMRERHEQELNALLETQQNTETDERVVNFAKVHIHAQKEKILPAVLHANFGQCIVRVDEDDATSGSKALAEALNKFEDYQLTLYQRAIIFEGNFETTFPQDHDTLLKSTNFIHLPTKSEEGVGNYKLCAKAPDGAAVLHATDEEGDGWWYVRNGDSGPLQALQAACGL